MKEKLKKALLALTLLAVTLPFSSCSTDDWWTSETLEGRWRIVEVGFGYGECPYRPGDRWEFYGNGEFHSWGFNGFEEYGVWDVSNRTVYISFDAYGPNDIACHLRNIDDQYVAMDVDDYSYGSRYTLRMVRDGW